MVANEIKCAGINTHYSNIHSKKQRIVAAFKQIQNENKDKILNEDFLDFDFSTSEIEIDTTVRLKPLYCRDEIERTKKKKPCSECESICAYSIEDLLDPNHGIGQADIKIELDNHNHPKSRKIEKRQLTTYEAP